MSPRPGAEWSIIKRGRCASCNWGRNECKFFGQWSSGRSAGPTLEKFGTSNSHQQTRAGVIIIITIIAVVIVTVITIIVIITITNQTNKLLFLLSCSSCLPLLLDKTRNETRVMKSSPASSSPPLCAIEINIGERKSFVEDLRRPRMTKESMQDGWRPKKTKGRLVDDGEKDSTREEDQGETKEHQWKHARGVETSRVSLTVILFSWCTD